MDKKIKIWVWWNDAYTRIEVGEKGTRLYWSGPSDEGWNSIEQYYWLEGDVLFYKNETDGRDCDGRLCRTSISKKPAVSDPNKWQTIIKKENNWVPDGHTYKLDGTIDVKEERPIILHEWEHENSDQYDEYAEAAGY